MHTGCSMKLMPCEQAGTAQASCKREKCCQYVRNCNAGALEKMLQVAACLQESTTVLTCECCLY